jgi:uncharacterized protein involved in exopolysaccharide biosynthesis
MPTRPLDPADPGVPREDQTSPGPVDLLRYAGKAVRRRLRFALGVFLAGLCVVAAYYAVATPRYRAEARVLAQRQQAIASLARANVTEEQPTRAASELIHQRENLVDLIKLAGLLEKPPKLGPLDRAWNDIVRFTGAARDEDDPVEQLVLVLDRQLKVTAGDATIGIELDWPNPQQAYVIVDGALQNFLEVRHVQEVAALDEAIAILRSRAARLRAELAQATDETRRALEQAAVRAAPRPRIAIPTPTPSPTPVPATGPQRQPLDEDLARVKSMLESRQRAIADVEEFRRRRLAELTVQYDSKRAVYTEDYPEMVKLRLDIAALDRDSSQLTALRAEERKLRDEYEALGARQPPQQPQLPLPQRDPALAPIEVVQPPVVGATPANIEQSERVRDARHRYEQVMESLNQAQVELDTARSAFSHRYKVTWPAQVPKRPVSPKPLKVLGIGGIASLVLALLGAVLAEWRAGQVLDRWQIEGGLGLPILGQVRRAR